MRVGVIGTGTVGRALATGLSAVGHEAVVGSRDPASARIGGIEVTTREAAAERGAAVVLAVPSGVVVDVAADLRDSIGDAAVVDPTNEYPEATAAEPVAARVADAVPEARVVKAFNTIGANLMTDPVVGGERASMFLAGDDPAAVGTVETLAADLGFEPVVAGDLAAAGRLESLARLWIDLSREYGRDVAFRFLRGGGG